MIYTLTLNPAVDRELTVPAMEFDSVLRASESRVDFGGKGFNVSRLLKGWKPQASLSDFWVETQVSFCRKACKALALVQISSGSLKKRVPMSAL